MCSVAKVFISDLFKLSLGVHLVSKTILVKSHKNLLRNIDSVGVNWIVYAKGVKVSQFSELVA